MDKWKARIKRKAPLFPDLFDLDGLDNIKQLEDLYERYLLRFMGHERLETYFEAHRSNKHLMEVEKPLLLINAQNDPLLADGSYPVEVPDAVEAFYPKKGGHLGFHLHGKGYSWLEVRVKVFFDGLA